MNAPIAQLDRVPAYEAVGSPFEPGWARQFVIKNKGNRIIYI